MLLVEPGAVPALLGAGKAPVTGAQGLLPVAFCW